MISRLTSTVNELCFELSHLNSRLYRVSDFVHSLINHQENPALLSYESTLKYARFPVLDVYIDDKDSFEKGALQEHREVFNILDWLQERKKVKSIMELDVPNRLINPHNKIEIADVIEKFEVEILKWKVLDLSLSAFNADKAKSRIKVLPLYSSGKRATISYGFSEEGLITFPKANS